MTIINGAAFRRTRAVRPPTLTAISRVPGTVILARCSILDYARSPIMIGERLRQNRLMAAKHFHGLGAVLALGIWLLTLQAYGQRERRLFPTTGKMRVEVL